MISNHGRTRTADLFRLQGRRSYHLSYVASGYIEPSAPLPAEGDWISYVARLHGNHMSFLHARRRFISFHRSFAFLGRAPLILYCFCRERHIPLSALGPGQPSPPLPGWKFQYVNVLFISVLCSGRRSVWIVSCSSSAEALCRGSISFRCAG